MKLVFSEPRCCGEPMVHNSWSSEFECAAAYFALVDDGWGEGSLELVTADEVGAELAPTLEHWRASRIPDGYEGEATP